MRRAPKYSTVSSNHRYNVVAKRKESSQKTDESQEIEQRLASKVSLLLILLVLKEQMCQLDCENETTYDSYKGLLMLGLPNK